MNRSFGKTESESDYMLTMETKELEINKMNFPFFFLYITIFNLFFYDKLNDHCPFI